MKVYIEPSFAYPFHTTRIVENFDFFHLVLLVDKAGGLLIVARLHRLEGLTVDRSFCRRVATTVAEGGVHQVCIM